VIQLYAFVRGLRNGAPHGLEAVAVGPVTAIVGPVDDDAARFGLAVQSLLDDAEAVLPARFGERFADAGALAEAVVPHADALARRLDDVADCVELVVRAARPVDEPAERAEDGGSYMRARLRQVTADAAAADALHGLLRSRARNTVLADRTLSKLVHDACYLVERDGVDEFARCVEEYAAAHPELDLACTGPWAPASFAGAAA
jgi:hypothetical protein